MEITIRAAQMKDLVDISAIESKCFPAAEAASDKSLKERLAAYQHSFLVAEKGMSIVGFINGCVTVRRKLADELFASTALHDDSAPYQMVFGLAVHPDERHQGIAVLLMNAFIAQAKQRGKKLITLTCKEELIPFYERFGYQNEGKSASVHGGACWYDMTLVLVKE